MHLTLKAFSKTNKGEIQREKSETLSEVHVSVPRNNTPLGVFSPIVLKFFRVKTEQCMFKIMTF